MNQILEPYRCVRDANLVSIKGGKWFIPQDQLDTIFGQIFDAPETLYLVEVAQPLTRFFVDIDSDHPLNRLGIRNKIESFLASVFKGSRWRACVLTRRHSHSVHMVFEGLIVTRTMLHDLTMILNRMIPEVDTNCKGLRLPGCYAGKVGDTPYYPLALAGTISQRIDEPLTPLRNNKTSLKAMYPHFSGQKRKQIESYEVPPHLLVKKRLFLRYTTPQSDGKEEMAHIRTLRPEWAMMYVTKSREVAYTVTRNNVKKKQFDHTINVGGPGSKSCLIKGADHRSNHIFFVVNKDGDYIQRCFSAHCKGAERRFRGPQDAFNES